MKFTLLILFLVPACTCYEKITTKEKYNVKISSQKIFMEDESMWLAGISSLFCPKDHQIGCIDYLKYVEFRDKNPRGFVASLAFKTLHQGPCVDLTDPDDRCPFGKIGFGIVTECLQCVIAGYGWCEEAHHTTYEEEERPPFAPLCIDTQRIEECPFTKTVPLTSPEECETNELTNGLIDVLCFICDNRIK